MVPGGPIPPSSWFYVSSIDGSWWTHPPHILVLCQQYWCILSPGGLSIIISTIDIFYKINKFINKTSVEHTIHIPVQRNGVYCNAKMVARNHGTRSFRCYKCNAFFYKFNTHHPLVTNYNTTWMVSNEDFVFVTYHQVHVWAMVQTSTLFNGYVIFSWDNSTCPDSSMRCPHLLLPCRRRRRP